MHKGISQAKGGHGRSAVGLMEAGHGTYKGAVGAKLLADRVVAAKDQQQLPAVNEVLRAQGL